MRRHNYGFRNVSRNDLTVGPLTKIPNKYVLFLCKTVSNQYRYHLLRDPFVVCGNYPFNQKLKRISYPPNLLVHQQPHVAPEAHATEAESMFPGINEMRDISACASHLFAFSF